MAIPAIPEILVPFCVNEDHCQPVFPVCAATGVWLGNILLGSASPALAA